MPERSHLSIGEVLSLLREEFPDVTISKIRFLESQGLVDPERTPSGYRKFYDHDVERLRWILRQQRENFLPLKVIRGRLSEQGEPLDDFEDGVEVEEESARLFTGSESPEPVGVSQAAASHRAAAAAAAPAAPAPAASSAASSAHPAAASRRRPDPPAERVARPLVEEGPAPAPTRVAASVPLPDDGESYSAEELGSAAGADILLVRELEQYGLISPHAVVAGTPYFDATALAVVKTAAGFARHGVEARHLRTWRNAVDREAGLFEQVVMPLLRQRNPEARRRAAATLAELASLGADMRQALIDQAIRQIR